MKYYPEPIKPNDWDRIKGAESFFDGIDVDLRHGGNRACYNLASDHVQMPERGAFHDAEGYYSTLAHECGHWTGSERRLDRQFGKRFGNQTYAFEELIAELSAAFTCAHLLRKEWLEPGVTFLLEDGTIVEQLGAVA